MLPEGTSQECPRREHPRNVPGGNIPGMSQESPRDNPGISQESTSQEVPGTTQEITSQEGPRDIPGGSIPGTSQDFHDLGPCYQKGHPRTSMTWDHMRAGMLLEGTSWEQPRTSREGMMRGQPRICLTSDGSPRYL